MRGRRFGAVTRVTQGTSQPKTLKKLCSTSSPTSWLPSPGTTWSRWVLPLYSQTCLEAEHLLSWWYAPMHLRASWLVLVSFLYIFLLPIPWACDHKGFAMVAPKCSISLSWWQDFHFPTFNTSPSWSWPLYMMLTSLLVLNTWRSKNVQDKVCPPKDPQYHVPTSVTASSIKPALARWADSVRNHPPLMSTSHSSQTLCTHDKSSSFNSPLLNLSDWKIFSLWASNFVWEERQWQQVTVLFSTLNSM
jgi:hypothetical protein